MSAAAKKPAAKPAASPVTDQTDAPAGLMFVTPDPTAARYRVCLWASPGSGKTTAAASAPGPILAVNADRPRAWQFARRAYPDKDIREVRYQGEQTLNDVWRYLRDHEDEIETLVLDPWQTIYDSLVDSAPRRGDGDVDYQTVNKKLVKFLHALRQFDVHVVILAHEKVNDGKRGDGKLYPQLGGAALINKVSQEMDLIAFVERQEAGEGEAPSYVGVLDPGTRPLVCKQGTGALGARRELDLEEWFRLEAAALAPLPVRSAPWDEDYDPEEGPADDAGDVQRSLEGQEA